MTTHPEEQTTIRIPGYRHIRDAKLIIRLEGNRNYTIVHLMHTPKLLLVSQTLKRFESQLPYFIRISKSELINPVFIDRVIKKDTNASFLRLVNGVCLLISRRRLADILPRLDT